MLFRVWHVRNINFVKLFCSQFKFFFYTNSTKCPLFEQLYKDHFFTHYGLPIVHFDSSSILCIIQSHHVFLVTETSVDEFCSKSKLEKVVVPENSSVSVPPFATSKLISKVNVTAALQFLIQFASLLSMHMNWFKRQHYYTKFEPKSIEMNDEDTILFMLELCSELLLLGIPQYSNFDTANLLFKIAKAVRLSC